MENLKLIAERSFNESFNEVSEFFTSCFSTIIKTFGIIFLVSCVISAITTMVIDEDTARPVVIASICINVLVLTFCCTLIAQVFHSYINGNEIKGVPVYRYLKNSLRNMMILLFSAPIYIIIEVIILVYIHLSSGENNTQWYFFTLLLFTIFLQFHTYIPIAYSIGEIEFQGKSGMSITPRVFRLYKCNWASTTIFTFIFSAITIAICTISFLPVELTESIKEMLFLPEDIVYTETTTKTIKFITSLLASMAELLCNLTFFVALCLKYGDTVELYDNIHFKSKMKNFDNL